MLPNDPFSWIRIVFTMTEQQLLECVGVDGAMFLRFFQLGLKFFSSILVLGIVAIFLNRYADPLNVEDSFDRLSVANVVDGSAVFTFHLIALYIYTFYLFYLL